MNDLQEHFYKLWIGIGYAIVATSVFGFIVAFASAF